MIALHANIASMADTFAGAWKTLMQTGLPILSQSRSRIDRRLLSKTLEKLKPRLVWAKETIRYSTHSL